MIDMIYNFRVGDIHAAKFFDEFNKLFIPDGLAMMLEIQD